MWYVVQVRTGDERKISERFQHEIKADGEDVFVPMFERRKNIKGRWTKGIALAPQKDGCVYEDPYDRV